MIFIIHRKFDSNNKLRQIDCINFTKNVIVFKEKVNGSNQPEYTTYMQTGKLMEPE